AGMSPGKEESAGKRLRQRITPGNRWISQGPRCSESSTIQYHLTKNGLPLLGLRPERCSREGRFPARQAFENDLAVSGPNVVGGYSEASRHYCRRRLVNHGILARLGGGMHASAHAFDGPSGGCKAQRTEGFLLEFLVFHEEIDYGSF